METSKGLFSTSLISPTIVASFPESYSIRPLERDDYSKGFFECLKVLTSTGDVTEKRFHELYDWMSTQGRGIHFMLVIEHDNRIVGTGALLVERKFIHNLGVIGHIEEISVAKDHQKKGLGLKLVQAVSSVAANVGCYKSTLGCSEANEAFYVKCGYEKRGTVMSEYYENVKPDYERG